MAAAQHKAAEKERRSFAKQQQVEAKAQKHKAQELCKRTVKEERLAPCPLLVVIALLLILLQSLAAHFTHPCMHPTDTIRLLFARGRKARKERAAAHKSLHWDLTRLLRFVAP